jgi:hypothetical protein
MMRSLASIRPVHKNAKAVPVKPIERPRARSREENTHVCKNRCFKTSHVNFTQCRSWTIAAMLSSRGTSIDTGTLVAKLLGRRNTT